MVFSMTKPRLLQYYLLQVQCKFPKNDLLPCPEVIQPDNCIYSPMPKSNFCLWIPKVAFYPYITLFKNIYFYYSFKNIYFPTSFICTHP